MQPYEEGECGTRDCGASQRDVKAIVQERYGSPDFLEFREIDKPLVRDEHGLVVRVRAASVNAADWHLMQRLPHVIAALLRQPSSRVPGLDMAGQVETVGKNVTRLRSRI